MAVEQCRKNGPIWTEDGVRAPDLLAAAEARATASRARPTGSQALQRHHSLAPGSSPAGTRRPKPALKGLPRVLFVLFISSDAEKGISCERQGGGCAINQLVGVKQPQTKQQL